MLRERERKRVFESHSNESHVFGVRATATKPKDVEPFPAKANMR